jgi:hypothetical protein
MKKSFNKYALVLVLTAVCVPTPYAQAGGLPLKGCQIIFGKESKIKLVRYSAPGISQSRREGSSVEFDRMISETKFMLEQKGRTPEIILEELAGRESHLKTDIERTLKSAKESDVKILWAGSESNVNVFNAHDKIIYVNPVDALDIGTGAREILINLQSPLSQAKWKYEYTAGMTKKEFIDTNVMKVGMAVVDGYIAEARLMHKLIQAGELKLSDIDAELLPALRIIEESGANVESRRMHLLTVIGGASVHGSEELNFAIWQRIVADAWQDIAK